MHSWDQTDVHWMKRTLALARRGAGTCRPNPRVGALVVQDNTCRGQGWHKKAGQEHAEVLALKEAGTFSRDSTLYVSLEPCNHYGKTNPCVAAIIEAGISRVVVAMKDPNSSVTGGGIAELRKAGISVELGVLEDEAKQLNLGWIHWIKTGRPLVLLKLAISLDGKAGKNSEQVWISSAVSQSQVQRLRRYADAVVVGAGTVLTDNPRLSNRTGRGEQPLRIVLDSQARTDPKSLVYQQKDGKAMLVTCPGVSEERLNLFQEAAPNVECLEIHRTASGVDLEELLRRLGERGVQTLLCEGGPRLASSLLSQGLCDHLILYQGACILGPEAIPWLTDRELFPKLKLQQSKRVGPDSRLLLKRR